MFSSVQSCARPQWPPRLVTVPGLRGSDHAHWQSWLERQFARALRVEQRDWDTPDLATWIDALTGLLACERGPFVLAAHSFGCLVAACALQRARNAACLDLMGRADMSGVDDIVGVLLVAPANPGKFGFADAIDTQRLAVPSILVGSETDPWMPAESAHALAQRLGSAFVNLGDAGHINTSAGFGPWPRAKHFVDTLAHVAAPRRLRVPLRERREAREERDARTAHEAHAGREKHGMHETQGRVFA